VGWENESEHRCFGFRTFIALVNGKKTAEKWDPLHIKNSNHVCVHAYLCSYFNDYFWQDTQKRPARGSRREGRKPLIFILCLSVAIKGYVYQFCFNIF
jgi:hypothetical protein